MKPVKTRTFMRLLLSIAFLITMSAYSMAQMPVLPVSKWVEKLSNPNDKRNEALRFLLDSVVRTGDSSNVNTFLQELQSNENSGNTYFKTRLDLLQAEALQHKDHVRSQYASKAMVMKLMKRAMQRANETDDDYLLAYASWVYSNVTLFYNEMDLSVTYAMYSTELNEQLFGTNEFPNYNFLAEQMYRLKEYDKCRLYCLKWLNTTPVRLTRDHQVFRMMMINTLALAYHRTGMYDSAMYYYNKALELATKLKKPEWKGIISGNMGQVYYLLNQYDTAIALLEMDYRESMANKYGENVSNAANALQWSARAYVAKGNNARALQQRREALVLIKQVRHEVYMQNIYYAAVTVYKANGLMDSAVYFSALYQQLHDSIEKKITASSVAIPNARLNEEKSMFQIRQLQEEKKAQLLKRNFIIAGIVLLLVISVLIINRQRIRYKYRREVSETEKKLIQTQMAADENQRNMFNKHSLEKSSLLENLEQMKEKDASAAQQESIRALSNLTILTAQDWDIFKELFEKTYPMFFQRLKTKAPGITLAEQRMAALTRLHLTTRQMASMQGISPDSVHKTRQRLRQRLLVANDVNLEEFLVSFQDKTHIN
jgi:DNA-binding CsgD family transcriptional regulator